MKQARKTREETRAEGTRALAYERTPWVAQERVMEEPGVRLQDPLRLELEMEEHLVEAALDGEAIRRAD